MIINSINLWCLLIIRLAKVKLDLRSNIMSVFAYKTAAINQVAVTKFFDITCKTVLLSLFASEHYNGNLLGLVSIYFEIVKTNCHSIFYLYCLVWLKETSHLSILRPKIWENKKFCIRLLVFLEHIIKYSAKRWYSFWCFVLCLSWYAWNKYHGKFYSLA